MSYSVRRDDGGRRRLLVDEINVSPPSPCSLDASSIVGGRVEVCLRRICIWWICSDLFIVRLRPRVFRQDPFDLHSLSAAVAVLVRWLYGALARQLPDCLLQVYNNVCPAPAREGR